MCLQSIEYCSNGLNIIIVDVSNLNNSLKFLKETTQKLTSNNYRIIEQKENKGFAAACNIGIQITLRENPGSFIWILNNDTVIDHETLPNLVNCYCKNADRNIAFIGSLILDFSDHDLIQYAGGEIDLKRAIFKVNEEGKKLSGLNLPEEINTDWVIGASMLFHASVISKIGFMPEDYFLYYEDIEWSLKANQKGFVNIVCTKSHVYHKQGSSTGLEYSTGQNFNPVTAKYYYSNYLKFFKKNFPEKLNRALFMMTKKTIGQLMRFNLSHSVIIYKALISHLKKT